MPQASLPARVSGIGRSAQTMQQARHLAAAAAQAGVTAQDSHEAAQDSHEAAQPGDQQLLPAGVQASMPGHDMSAQTQQQRQHMAHALVQAGRIPQHMDAEANAQTYQPDRLSEASRDGDAQTGWQRPHQQAPAGVQAGSNASSAHAQTVQQIQPVAQAGTQASPTAASSSDQTLAQMQQQLLAPDQLASGSQTAPVQTQVVYQHAQQAVQTVTATDGSPTPAQQQAAAATHARGHGLDNGVQTIQQQQQLPHHAAVASVPVQASSVQVCKGLVYVSVGCCLALSKLATRIARHLMLVMDALMAHFAQHHGLETWQRKLTWTAAGIHLPIANRHGLGAAYRCISSE